EGGLLGLLGSARSGAAPPTAPPRLIVHHSARPLLEIGEAFPERWLGDAHVDQVLAQPHDTLFRRGRVPLVFSALLDQRRERPKLLNVEAARFVHAVYPRHHTLSVFEQKF